MIEGEETEAHVGGERALGIAYNQDREDALKRIRAFGKTLPADWKFDREGANSREFA